MAYAPNNYTGNGTTVLFPFSFPYIDRAHVKVKVNGVLTTAFTFANDSTIQLDSAPAAGISVSIFRETPTDAAEATIFSGSSIRASDLNANTTQLLYVAEETEYISNQASSTADGIASTAASAVATANSALNTANAATATANNALNVANGIAGTAQNAVNIATAAENTANGIAGTANTALSTANSAAAAANNAVNTANNALSTANGIAGTANSALSAANSAVNTANAAQNTANAALPKAGGQLTGDVTNTATGFFELPAGTTGQRPGSADPGMVRFNTDTNQFEGRNNAGWGALGGGATGAAGNQVFYENDQTVTNSYTITAGKNAITAGPITIPSGVTVTIPSGSSWVIV